MKLNRAATGKLPKVAVPAEDNKGEDNKGVAARLFGRGLGRTYKPRAAPVLPEDDGADETELEDWEAELPPPTPEDIASALGNSLNSRGVTEADVDRLWDWIRADVDRGKAFLGMVPTTSTQLRQALTAFGSGLYALEDSALEGETHMGFAAVQLFEPNRAAVHVYLAAGSRGDGRRLLPQLLEMAEGAYPGRVFVIITDDAAAARLYRGIGFKASFLLTWIPTPKPEANEPDEASEGETDG